MGSEIPKYNVHFGKDQSETFVRDDEKGIVVMVTDHQRIVAALEAQVAALSKPVSDKEWAAAKKDGNYLWRDTFNTAIAARLKEQK